MKYTDLTIQTQREAPNNARTQGFAFLVCAGYHTRESQPAALGERAFKHVYNDADLIGCPVRVTVGERGLQNNSVRIRSHQCRGLSRADLEPYIGSRVRVSEILNRKRPLTLAMIQRLHAGLDIPAQVLIQSYELAKLPGNRPHSIAA